MTWYIREYEDIPKAKTLTGTQIKEITVTLVLTEHITYLTSIFAR